MNKRKFTVEIEVAETDTEGQVAEKEIEPNIEKEKVCKCEVCGEEKLCAFVGKNNGSPFYACNECIQEELLNAFKEYRGNQ